jgi:ATP-dependent Clp protease ATP-binding subunit ClpC
MLELANLVGSSAASGDIAARITRMVQEIEISGNIILYIPDIHNLTKGGNAVALSAADALIPIIMNNEFPVIGATYPREFAQFIEPRSDFVGAFEVVRMEEISDDEAEELLVLEAVPLERQTKVVISFGAIRESVKLGKKYFRTKLLPSSAAELLKEAVVEVARRGDKVVGVAQIVKVAEEKINVPIHEASGEEVDTLLKLEEIIHQRFIDQEEAVKAVARALREYRSGLARKKGPIASFLFVGPTGVGKTELAKILADIQFGSESMMLRFDMSEYKDKQSFFRFIGSPDRQVSGALSDAILQKPYSLVLLDEFEKAYPEILDVFLQVLDDGRLTDNMGRIVDFSNTIIIATSNAHADIVNEALQKGESVAQLSDYLKRRLTDIFKPELLNRFSQIVVFKNLSPDDLAQVTRLSLKEFESLLKEQDIAIVFSDDAIRRLAKLGYDPVFGARPLRQVINDQLRAPLSEKILKKEIGRGSRLSVSVVGEAFVFTDESVKRV